MLHYWWSHRECSTSKSVLTALADLLKIPIAQAIAEAGGKTSEEVRSENGRRAVSESTPADHRAGWLAASDHRAAGKKSAIARIGLRLPRETVEKRRQSPARIFADEKALAALVAESKTHDGRIRRSLTGHQIHIPRPNTDQLRTWASETSHRVGVCVGKVVEIWEPLLEQQGFPRRRGPRFDRERCQALCKMLA